MTSIHNVEPTTTQHIATLLDDLITWRIIGNRTTDSRGISNVQSHGSAWMPIDDSFDRILYWRTTDNNSFQLVEYSMSKNLLHNAVELNFGFPTNVFPNVFVVELPDSNKICLMFATHLGVYRWLLKHPNDSDHNTSESSYSILAEIKEDFLTERSHFYRFDLQTYGQVTCSYSTHCLIYGFHNEMETLVLRFDNQNHLSSPQQLTFPKRASTGLFNFLWNTNKSNQLNHANQSLITGQTTMFYGTTALTIVLYDNGLLRFLSEQMDTILHEHNISDDLGQTLTKSSKKMFIDYCQYETFADELITRLFIVVDGHDLVDLLIYEFQYDPRNNFVFTIYQNKAYSKNMNSNEHSHLPHGASLTSLTCTNDQLLLQFVTSQNRPLLLLVQYETKSNVHERFISLPIDKHSKYVNDDSASIDDIHQQLNSPGEFTIDMIKEALWITFNFNIDDFQQTSTSVQQILQQLPTILQTLCDQHCDEQAIQNEDRLQVLTKFWQSFYSTMIDLRAQALVLLGCSIREERQLFLIIHKAAVSFYTTARKASKIDPKFLNFTKDVEHLLKTSDEQTLLRIDDAIFNHANSTDQQFASTQLAQIHKHLEPIVNFDRIVEGLQAMFDKSQSKENPMETETTKWTSKIAKRLLVLLFVQQCEERIEQLERLQKLVSLVFRSQEHQKRILSHRLERVQENVLPYLQDLLQIHQTLLWISSCPIESPVGSIDDRDLFIEHLLQLQYKNRLGTQSLIEQILSDHMPQDQDQINGQHWFQALNQAVENIFTSFWPNNDFLLQYLPSRHQWSTLDQYCSKLSWYKPLNSARHFFQALTFYRSGISIEAGNRYLASVLQDLNTDPLLIELFGKQTNPELTFIEWIRDYLKFFGRNQNVASFLQQALHNTSRNEIRSLIIRTLFQTTLELKSFDDAFWCIQNTSDYLSQKQYTFEYATAISLLPLDQSLYRFQKLFEYQCDKLGHLDIELLAHMERTCVEQQPIQKSQSFTLYKIYEMLKWPLKMAQIMYHYGNSVTDIREQREALQLACNALLSIPSGHDSTDRLFIYPIQNEYHFVAPLHEHHSNVRLIGLEECRQRLAISSAIYTLKNDPVSATIQVTDTMHPTQLSGLLTKFHHPQEARQLLEAFQINPSKLPTIIY